MTGAQRTNKRAGCRLRRNNNLSTYCRRSLIMMRPTMKRSFLIPAFLIVSIIALPYGISPAWFAHRFLGITELNMNVAHILRAVMGLYLGLGLFWLCAAFSDKHRNTAVLTHDHLCWWLSHRSNHQLYYRWSTSTAFDYLSHTGNHAYPRCVLDLHAS